LQKQLSEANHTFVLSWNFPNLYAASSFRKISDTKEGHYYSNFFDNALAVAEYAATERASLYQRSKTFQSNFFDSSADVVVSNK